jgi:hypothetical protein
MPEPRPVDISCDAFDTVAARQYLAGVEALAREARLSQDRRVLAAALRVLAEQSATVNNLLG